MSGRCYICDKKLEIIKFHPVTRKSDCCGECLKVSNDLFKDPGLDVSILREKNAR